MEFKQGLSANGEQPYAASTNHTIKLSRLAAKYAQLHDRYAALINDADRHEREAERSRKEANELLKEVKATGAELRDMVSTNG